MRRLEREVVRLGEGKGYGRVGLGGRGRVRRCIGVGEMLVKEGVRRGN